jgi:hypothetical protein
LEVAEINYSNGFLFIIGGLEEEDMSAIAMIVIEKKIPTNNTPLVTLVT